MKSIIALLCIALVISSNALLSQSNSVKQSADACPSWSKKQAKTSTDYASLSKRSAASTSSDFAKPKYQSIYSKNTSKKYEVNKGKSAASPEHTATSTSRTEKRTTTSTEEKNESSKSTRTSVPVETPNLKEEKELTLVKETTVKETIVTEPVKEKIDLKTEEENPAPAQPKNQTKAKETGKSTEKTTAALKKEKKEEAIKKSKQKQQRKNIVNKLRTGKKNATDCPDF